MKTAFKDSDRNAQREIITACDSQFLSFKVDTDIWTTWHYRPEIDLLLTLKNTGYHITGDYIGELKPGTLILNGSNVPHAFHPNEQNEGDPEKPAMLVLQFSEDSLGKSFLSKLEMSRIRTFLESTGRSYEFFGKTRDRVDGLMREMADQNDAQRLAQFILILDALASAPESDYVPLVSPVYSPSLNPINVDRIDNIKSWILKNLESTIRLDDVAREARMSAKSFSRFFKKNTGKAFISYVNELRIGLACQRIIETDASISEVCFSSGFNNLSNFNRRFKEVKGVSPRDLRAQYREQLDLGQRCS